MNSVNEKVDKYLVDGCMRCKFGGTPECKVNTWQKELKTLRIIVLDCGLNEELKWGVPVYTFNEENIAIVSAFNNHCALSFFKGALLQDTDGILVKPGENTQAARLIKFTDVREIVDLEAVLKAYIYEAIEVEKAGLKVEFEKKLEPFPEELEHKFEEDPILKAAFEALTPGRQRGFLLHFSQPKQSITRTSRIEKCMPKILNGVGLHDHYKGGG